MSLLTKVTKLPGYIALAVLVLGNTVIYAQQTTVSEGLSRLAGTEETSHIEYVRLFLDGTQGAPPPDTATLPPIPVLTAQCTRRPSGKFVFELFANFGGVDDRAFYPPWTPANGRDLFPPHLDRYKITMEFLGYTHVKPVKREWEAVLQPAGQYRYNPPSSTSSNLEDSPYYLRFLLAPPTLHLTLADKSAEFHTTPLLDQIRKEPPMQSRRPLTKVFAHKLCRLVSAAEECESSPGHNRGLQHPEKRTLVSDPARNGYPMYRVWDTSLPRRNANFPAKFTCQAPKSPKPLPIMQIHLA